ncbi:cytochrome b561 and DOMON domain-containing protein At5g47530-like [Phalaenopsis equestris]|uniref:cytochrome b561 and DOMON domain-containing protein At5g47530-like n=1 Tax=Phalaenopsis equestris TaxID=78828 RepID=UPI0009E546D7|nr:cytochrome b561 and DOMON domain-containing protein At5g47530-like [Phalaenopsis equestris]
MSMSIIPLLLLLFLLPSSTPQQSCTLDNFSKNRIFTLCNSLPELSSTLHWTYHASNSTVDIAYRAPQSADGWIAWALNPTGSGMIGAQAIFAFLDSTGSMTAISYPLANTSPTVSNISLSYKVYSMESEFANGVMIIYATIELPGNKTRINQVWQVSDLFTNGFPNGHRTTGPNVLSTGVLDLLSGQFTAAGNSRLNLKNRHGVLNAVSWGILMPIGAIMARYLRVFKSADPAWFYLHVGCQISAYAVGVSGWVIGLMLGSDSKGITYHTHRNIGIALFCLATLQVFALFLRPNKKHKHRFYWNIYHHLTGYAVIILSVINIFKGFDILQPENKWKQAYIAIVSALGGIAVILEAATWAIVLNRKKKSGSSDKFQQGENGGNGNAGYGSRYNQEA